MPKTKPKSAKKPVARKPWKTVLADLVEYLNAHDSDAKKLWAVISAFRGPDAPDIVSLGIKCATTGVIRRAVGLTPGPHWMVNCPDTDIGVQTRVRQLDGAVNAHFWDHASDAFRTLGLSWGGYNKPEDAQ